MEDLLNLETLTEVERNTILNVLKRDEELQQSQSGKVGQLKREIQTVRMRSVLRNGDDLTKMCARCHSQLGLFNRGSICPQCRFRICRMCQESLFIDGTWLCTLCYKLKQLKWLSGDLIASMDGNTMRRWSSGADLVKASLTLSANYINIDGSADLDDSDADIEKSNITNNNEPLYQSQTIVLQEPNHGVRRSEHAQTTRRSNPSDVDRVECPQEGDKQKLKELFDSFRSKTKPAQNNPPEATTILRVSSRKYSETDSSSSDDDDPTLSGPSGQGSVRSSSAMSTGKVSSMSDSENVCELENQLPKSRIVPISVSSSNQQNDSLNHAFMSEPSPQKQKRKISPTTVLVESSIQQLPLSESTSSDTLHATPSTVTLTNDQPPRTPSPAAQPDSRERSAFQTFKMTATEAILALKATRSFSSLSQKPDNASPRSPSIPNEENMLDRRSPSLISVSMDSLPSSRGPSPPVKHRLLELAADRRGSRDSSDTDSLSHMSQYSGTESQVREGSSEADDYVVEELSQVRFRRMSKKVSAHEIQSVLTPKNKLPKPSVSPRLGSDESGSLDDSGHVSGASQEHTPEHRRTNSEQSQSSTRSSTHSTLTDEQEEDIDSLVLHHNTSQYGNLLTTIADSKESIVSFYSNAGDIDYGRLPITGEILFGLGYNYKTGCLEVHIKKCKDIAAADIKRKRSDPYVKTYLLPDKTRSGKRKTKVKKHTLNPTFDEVLRYLITEGELKNRTLWLTLWHNDRFGRNDFLGEVSINFDYYKFGDPTPMWYPLEERMEAQHAAMITYKGDIILSVRYVTPDKVTTTKDVSPSRKKGRRSKSDGCNGELHVLVKEARNLTAVRSNGFSDPFCKGYLLPEKLKGLKQKTPVIRKECNPVWNHTMVFDVEGLLEELNERSLELTIWDHDKLSTNDFLGGVRLNLGMGISCGKPVDWMDARGEEISLWQSMLDRPNIWIDGSLMLRPNMSKRNF